MSSDIVIIIIVLNIAAVLFFLITFVQTVKTSKSFNLRTNVVKWFTEHYRTLYCKKQPT